MSEFNEVLLKLGTLVLVLALLVALERGRWAFARRRRRPLLVGLTALGMLAWVNFGGFHTDGSKLHPWDQLHYVLNSKYFPELGYDGLYAALLTARAERADLPLPKRTRDLRSMQVVATSELSAHQNEVRARFSRERWTEFAADANAVWIRDEFFLDHGYLPTPAHTAVSRLVSNHLRFSVNGMRVAASLDLALLGLAGWAVLSWVSLETMAAMALMFGLGFCTRYYWLGGAFLRLDWLAAVVVCGAALCSGRFLLAGIMLGYASMVRVFPAFFVLPLLAHLLAARKRGDSSLAPGRFAVGYGGAALVLFVAGSLQGHGMNAWLESAKRLARVARATFPNAIGLRVPFVTSAANFKGELVNPESLYLLDQIALDYARLLHERFWIWALAASVVAGACLSVAYRTRAPQVAFASGVGVVFALASAACYYGGYFVVLAFREPLRTATVFLCGQLATYLVAACVLWLAAHGFMVLNGAAVFAPTSILLGVVLALWWLRARRSEPTSAAL